MYVYGRGGNDNICMGSTRLNAASLAGTTR
jgi:hypothetical protein